MKKAALEKLSQKCEIFFFSLKSIKWAGRWGALPNGHKLRISVKKKG